MSWAQIILSVTARTNNCSTSMPLQYLKSDEERVAEEAAADERRNRRSDRSAVVEDKSKKAVPVVDNTCMRAINAQNVHRVKMVIAVMPIVEVIA